MHKLQHDILPAVFLTYFITQNNIHSKNTRRSTDFRLPIFRTSFAQNQSIRYHGINKWNNLESSLKCLNLCCFKKKNENVPFASYTTFSMLHC